MSLPFVLYNQHKLIWRKYILFLQIALNDWHRKYHHRIFHIEVDDKSIFTMDIYLYIICMYQWYLHQFMHISIWLHSGCIWNICMWKTFCNCLLTVLCMLKILFYFCHSIFYLFTNFSIESVKYIYSYTLSKIIKSLHGINCDCHKRDDTQNKILFYSNQEKATCVDVHCWSQQSVSTVYRMASHSGCMKMWFRCIFHNLQDHTFPRIGKSTLLSFEPIALCYC